MTFGPLWTRTNDKPRRLVSGLVAREMPSSPGVYALYRGGTPVYVGKAKQLSGRWKNHLGRGRSMANSALRRNVAESLGVATSADIKARRYLPTLADVEAVTAWLSPCEVTWVECATHEAAKALETDTKREWMPRLTKM